MDTCSQPRLMLRSRVTARKIPAWPTPVSEQGDADTERILLVVGSGHVHIIRHLLTEFPQFLSREPVTISTTRRLIH